MLVIKISLYLLAFVFSNFIVLWFGQYGLIFTALFLIPFDFVMRCIFHETWKGKELVIKLGGIVSAASLITLIININTLNIALGSFWGFLSAQIVAGIFYQFNINKSYFIKVNGSDLFAIIADSIMFQLVAFQSINTTVTLSQITLKVLGGLFWYWLLFNKLKLQDKWL